MPNNTTKLCIICGLQEVDSGSICPACAEGVKREALGQQAQLKRRAEQEIRRQGINPDEAEPRAEGEHR